MKITTSTYPRPGMGGFALLHSGQIDQMMEQGNGLIMAQYNYNYKYEKIGPNWGQAYYEQKEDTFRFVTEKEGSMAFVTLTNADYGEVLMLIEQNFGKDILISE